MNKNHELSAPEQASVRDGTCEVDQVDACKVTEARNSLPRHDLFQDAADAFRALANPNRLKVLKALEGRELCVCDLREVLGISMSGTSQVLRELRNLGAVAFEARGKLAFYRIADPFWLQLVESVLTHIDPAGVQPTPGRSPEDLS